MTDTNRTPTDTNRITNVRVPIKTDNERTSTEYNEHDFLIFIRCMRWKVLNMLKILQRTQRTPTETDGHGTHTPSQKRTRNE